MKVLRVRSTRISGGGRRAALVAALLVALGPGAALGQKRAQKPPPGPGPGTSQTYESLVNRPVKPLEWAPRPVIAGRGGALVAILGGRVYASLDSGERWAPVGDLADEVIALTPVGADTWRCIARSGRVVESRDDGRTWTTASALDTVARTPGAVIASGGFDAAGEGWAATEGPAGTVVASAAGAWMRLEGVHGRVTTGWREGSTVAVLAGQDLYRAEVAEGARFERMSSLQGASLNAVVLVGGGRALIGADRGLVIETRDGGTSWLPRPAAGQSTLEAIGLGSAFWAVGRDANRGVLFVSSDDGRTWQRVLDSTLPLSRPIAHAGRVWLVDGAGTAWTAAALAGPWRRAGAVLPGAAVDAKPPKSPNPKADPKPDPKKKKKG